MGEDNHSVTRLLSDYRNGDPQAEQKLLPLVYDELKRLAQNHMNLIQQSTGAVQILNLISSPYSQPVVPVLTLMTGPTVSLEMTWR